MLEPTRRLRTLLRDAGAAAALAVAVGCEGAPDEEVCEPQVELIDRTTQALGTGALQWVDGTYGAGCASHTNGEAWSLRIRGSTAMTNPALSVVKGDSDCVLTVTGLRADAIYMATPSLALGTSYNATASAFAVPASPVAFYANARISSTAFAADFTVTITYSNDLASVSPTSTASYASYPATAGDTVVPAPDYTASLANLAVQVDGSSVVTSATGTAALTAGAQAGQHYVVVAGRVGGSYAAVDAAYTAAGTPTAIASTIPAASFALVGQTLPVTRSVIISNTSDGVRAYEVIYLGFKSCVGAYLCDEFERSSGIGAWDFSTLSGGSTIATPTDRPLGGARSLRCTLGTAEAASAMLTRSVARTGNITVRYALYVDAAFSERGFSFSAVNHVDGSREVEQYIYVDAWANTVGLVEQEWAISFINSIATTPLVRGRWVEVVITIDRSTSPWRATFSYDGVVVVNSVALAKTVTSGSSTHAVRMGVTWSTAGAATNVYADDVRVDVAP